MYRVRGEGIKKLNLSYVGFFFFLSGGVLEY